ncbi:hypothetical protein AgCh_000764 [Apium graveolens]
MLDEHLAPFWKPGRDGILLTLVMLLPYAYSFQKDICILGTPNLGDYFPVLKKMDLQERSGTLVKKNDALDELIKISLGSREEFDKTHIEHLLMDSKITPGIESVKKYISSLSATSTSAQLANHGLIELSDCGAMVSEQEHFIPEEHTQSYEIAAMADSFILISAAHSEPSVGVSSSDPRPVVPPVLAILPPPVLQHVPLQAIPPLGMRPPIRGPPPADSGFTSHSVTGRFLQGQIQELLHIMHTREVGSGERRLRERLQAFRRAAAVRFAEATHEDITPDFLVEWAKWVLEELEEIGGPDLP